MNDVERFTVLKSLGSLAGLWVLLFWLYRDLRIDLFRQELFSLRDELFDYAASGAISFDHPAYGTLRMTMNGYTRFAHRMTLLQVLLYVYLPRRPREPDVEWRFDSHWASVAEGLGPDVRERLDDYISRMHALVLKHVVYGSPLLVLLLLASVSVVLVGLAFRYRMLRLLKAFEGPLSRIDAAAVAGA